MPKGDHSFPIDMVGKKIGRLKVLKRIPNKIGSTHARWLCRCDCGHEKVILGMSLRKPSPTKSCGCLKKELLIERSTTHGKTATPEWQLWENARHRSKRDGFPCNLDLADIVIPKQCPLLNIPLKRGIRKSSRNSPSLDRIDSTKGYIKGNIWVISMQANQMKSDASLDDLKTLTANLEKKINGTF